jgi:hypothetical protein
MSTASAPAAAIAHDVRSEPSREPRATTARTLPVTAMYWLSESGRKAALLAGQDGRAKQAITIDVPLARLHLVSVDDAGIARLKLRPRYERDAEQRIVRFDTAPTYDAPPTIEDLFSHAARNYELERLHDSVRAAARLQRVDVERELRAQTTQVFLTDPSQRAIVHPAPTPTRCYVLTEKGRRLFDTASDEGLARELPPEAHKRFRADLRARAEKNRQERAAQQALHESKKATIAVWIAEHGTPDQRARQAAGMLPLDEAIEALTVHVFAPAGNRQCYVRDGVARLQQHLRTWSATYAEITIAGSDLVVASTEPATATQTQWTLMQELRTALPLATVRLRAHRLSWRQDDRAPALTVFSVAVTQKEGLFTLRREYAAPD